jgi:hypothetical protein
MDNILKKTELQVKDMVSSFARSSIYKFERERDAFVACDLVINVLAAGEVRKALTMAEILVKENQKDPISKTYSDPKSKKINLTYALCLLQAEK